jgi:hypothetical protein
MRAILSISGSAALAAAFALSFSEAAAQANPVATHLGHVRTAFPQTPGGEGLLPTALAEAQVAIQHAGLAASNPANLDAMKLHATHVVNAVDPSRVAQGPGRGFGVKRATEGVVQHIGFAAGAQGASQNVATHSGHITTAGQTVITRADEILALADRIAAAGTAAEAAALVQELQTVAGQLVAGRDANGDGRITWESGEGGLQHVEQHVGLLATGEGLD